MKLHFLTSFLICLLSVSACKKDDQPASPSGSATPTDPRTAYVGNYIMTDSIFFGTTSSTFQGVETYVLQIRIDGSTGDTLFFHNLNNNNVTYFGLRASNFVSFPEQTSPDPLSGTAMFDLPSLSYAIDKGPFEYIGTGMRQ